MIKLIKNTVTQILDKATNVTQGLIKFCRVNVKLIGEKKNENRNRIVKTMSK